MEMESMLYQLLKELFPAFHCDDLFLPTFITAIAAVRLSIDFCTIYNIFYIYS